MKKLILAAAAISMLSNSCSVKPVQGEEVMKSTKKFKKIGKNVFAVTADTSQELAKLFLRFQENYESPQFKDTAFTLEEFKEWYQTSRGAKTFTYYTDWGGFNVPGKIINRFINCSEFKCENEYGEGLCFDPLSEDEKWLVKKIVEAKVKGKYYVIGYAKGSSSTLQHETAHAMFYIDHEYRKQVGKILHKNEEVLVDLGKHLLSIGYANSVVEDEKHAYLLSNRAGLKAQKLWIPQFDMINRQLTNIFNKYKK